ncbi:MAG: NAD(+) diphosphatase, partial [Lachnospiraceae bacterium]|nr:NAD(+) diphosphatase [Lachnospiraceae bacterium]
MLFHEIEPAVFHNEYIPCKAEKTDFFLGFKGNEVLAAENEGQIALPTVGEALAAYGDCGEFRYLFSIDSKRFFTLTEKECEPFGPYTLQNMRWLRVIKPLALSYAAAVGAQLYAWYRRRRFCGGCGHALVHAENERMMRCPVCGEMYYPTISPSVIVAVRDGERILLTKYSPTHFPQSTHNVKV